VYGTPGRIGYHLGGSEANMRSREIKAMVRELEREEQEKVADLTRIRSALEFMRRRAAEAETAEAAERAAMPQVEVSVPATEAPKITIQPPVARLLFGKLTIADLIDRVLDAKPIGAREIGRRVRLLPDAPHIKDETIRWNLSNKHTERGWVRSGTRANALWSKVTTKEVAHG
jgi:hypothetical protein